MPWHMDYRNKLVRSKYFSPFLSKLGIRCRRQAGLNMNNIAYGNWLFGFAWHDDYVWRRWTDYVKVEHHSWHGWAMLQWGTRVNFFSGWSIFSTRATQLPGTPVSSSLTEIRVDYSLKYSTNSIRDSASS